MVLRIAILLTFLFPVHAVMARDELRVGHRLQNLQFDATSDQPELKIDRKTVVFVFASW